MTNNTRIFKDWKIGCYNAESPDGNYKLWIAVWQQYDNEYGYRDEKVNAIKDIANIQDNFMYMLAMFDWQNQYKVISLLKEDTKRAVRERMIDGGNDESYLSLIGLRTN